MVQVVLRSEEPVPAGGERAPCCRKPQLADNL